MSKREQILSALFERLKSLDITVKRNELAPQAIPKNGILILRDGKQGEPEVILSPPICIFHHEAELEVIVQDAKSEVRDKKLDEILVKVGTLLCCEDKLNGLTDYIYPKQPDSGRFRIFNHKRFIIGEGLHFKGDSQLSI